MSNADPLWEGIPMPTPTERERMEHMDEELQRVWRREQAGVEVELPSAVKFGQALRTTAKTIQRLVQKMQDLWGIPVAYDHRRHGYEYTEEVAFLPFLQLSEGEIVAFYLSQKQGLWEGTSFRKRLQSAFRKMLGLFGKKLSFDPRLLDECFSFESAGPHAKFRPEFLDVCARAMLRKEELIVTYVKHYGEGAGKPEVRRLRPLHITYRDYAFYVVCQDPNRPEPRLFMVTRMQAVEETKVKFTWPKDFNAKAYLETAFKLFRSEKKDLELVALDFSPEAASRVMERRWHGTQQFTKLANGGVRLTIEVGLAPDLYSWIGGFFGECRVVGPEALRVKMRELHLQGARQ